MPAPLVNAPPFLRRGRRTGAIMGDVLLALVPVTAASLWYFQWKALWLLTVTVVSCCLAEFVCRKERDFDGSAAVTGVLLALSLPSGTPLWAAAVAGFFAIAVVKELFGGIGRNLLNPAMAGRALLMTVWPQTVSGYELPDAVSSATPLSQIGEVDWWSLLCGSTNGSMGETSALLILLGGAYLYLRGMIRLRAPLTCLGVFAAVIWVFGGDVPFTGNAAAHLLSGGLMLAAFFMVTDYTTKPVTPWGEGRFAAGVGALTAVLRRWGPYPEGVCFAILMMNLLSPLLEHITRRRVYGVRVPLSRHRMETEA